MLSVGSESTLLFVDHGLEACLRHVLHQRLSTEAAFCHQVRWVFQTFYFRESDDCFGLLLL